MVIGDKIKMKKAYVSMLLILILPLLMSNSPSPYAETYIYEDYKEENAIVKITKAETDDHCVFSYSSQITNTGEGVINLNYSAVFYKPLGSMQLYDNARFSNCREKDNITESMYYIFPGETADYSLSVVDNLFSQKADASEIDYKLNINGYVKPATGTVFTYGGMEIINYDSSDDMTTAKIFFSLKNPSNSGSSNTVIKFMADDSIYRVMADSFCAKEGDYNYTDNIKVKGDLYGKTISGVKAVVLPVNPYYIYFENISRSFNISETVKTVFLIVLIVLLSTIAILTAAVFIAFAKVSKK